MGPREQCTSPQEQVTERHVPKSSSPTRIAMSSNPLPTSRTQLLALYGEAMLAAQEFEEALAGLLGVRRELALIAADELTEEVQEELERLWNSLFTRTAGSLRNELGLAGGLGIAVDKAIDARNLLAHHYLRDRAVRLSQDCLEGGDLGRLETTTERFRHLAQRLDVERFAAMHEAGLTDDEVTTPGEARRIRYYDPRLDDEVPPEPFED